MDAPSANQTSESRDGTGAGDRDYPFAWGNPRQYLTLLCQARLTVMRGYVLDTKRGERGGAADGDLAYTDSDPQISVEAPAPVSEPEPMPDEGFYDG